MLSSLSVKFGKDKMKTIISNKTSVAFFAVGFVIIFLPRNNIHPNIFISGCAAYFIGILGFFSNLFTAKIKTPNASLALLSCMTATFLVIFLTFKVYSNITEMNRMEIETKGQTTQAIVTGVSKSVSLKGRKQFLVYISYMVKGKKYTPVLEPSFSSEKFYAIGDTLLITYSTEHPNLFKVTENHNQNALREKERIIEVFKKGMNK